jgi:hypothetical protein
MSSPRSWEFTYSGPGLSLNAFYSGMHWTKRQKLKDSWKLVFRSLLKKAKVEQMQAYKVGLRYRSKHDCDNVIPLFKMLNDELKAGLVPEDSPKYWKELSIAYAPELPTNTFIFTITEIL